MHFIVGDDYCRTGKIFTVHEAQYDLLLSKMHFIIKVSLRNVNTHGTGMHVHDKADAQHQVSKHKSHRLFQDGDRAPM
jgi:hypothetical protein